MRLDGHSYSPALRQRLVTLAGQLGSFEQVAVAFATAADVPISGRHVQRLTQEVGAGLARRRDEQAQRYRRRELPAGPEPPALAVVEVDGGRLGTRQPASGPGVHQPQAKEDKVACLLRMRSESRDTDPEPEPPPAFRDCRRVARLVQQMQGQAAPPTEAPAVGPAPEGEAGAAAPRRPGKPEALGRTCLASLSDSRTFGLLVAAEAQAQGFFQAQRQAFVADGQAYNWWIQRAYFPHFVAVADFLHVLCYLYRAAWEVGEDDAGRWRQFDAWMTACWQGRVEAVLAELVTWLLRRSRSPPAGAEPGCAPAAVAEAVSYLGNNGARMDYPAYRRQGLPVTSSLVESLVGEFNARVKGRDKWWNRQQGEAATGAEAILQVRAAVLSDDDPLAQYFAQSPGCPYRRRSAG